jgi:hypothetical protein
MQDKYAIRGELIINNENFKNIKKNKTDPRSMVSGLVNK